MTKHTWDRAKLNDVTCTSQPRTEWDGDKQLLEECLRLRECMLNRLGDSDDAFATKLIEAENVHDIGEEEIRSAARRATLARVSGLSVPLYFRDCLQLRGELLTYELSNSSI